MTFSYSADPSTSDKDKIRFLIGDIDSNEQLLSDEEINYLNSKHDNTWGACAEACEAIVAQYSKRANIGLSGGLDANLSDKVEHYTSLAQDFRRKSASAHVPIDGSGDPSFERGQFDN